MGKVEGFCNFRGCFTPERRTPDNVDFLFDTKPDSGFNDNIGPALSSDAAHVAQFQIMRAVCSNVSLHIFHNAGIQCQVAVLVRTNRTELLRNYLSVLRGIASALATGILMGIRLARKGVINNLRRSPTVTALVIIPRN